MSESRERPPLSPFHAAYEEIERGISRACDLYTMLSTGKIPDPDYYDFLDYAAPLPEELDFGGGPAPDTPRPQDLWVAGAFAALWTDLPQFQRHLAAVSPTANLVRSGTIPGWRGVDYANAHEACVGLITDLCDEAWRATNALPPCTPQGDRPPMTERYWQEVLPKVLEKHGDAIRRRFKALPDPKPVTPGLLAAARLERDQAEARVQPDVSPPPAEQPQNPDTRKGRRKAGKKGEPPPRSWTQPDLDDAIRKYKADRAGTYYDLLEGVRKGRPGALQAAREMYGRNAVARALGVKSRAMVSKSPVWREIAEELGLPHKGGKRPLAQRPRIDLSIAEEEKAEAFGDPTVDRAIRNETVAIIRRSKMTKKAAEDTLSMLEAGQISDDSARYIAQLAEDQRKDNTHQIHQRP